jgi:putative hydrolase of the HAD superfamily
MPAEPRAIVFDLDDTLYPYRRFLASGFVAIARAIGERHRVEPRWVFDALMRASRSPARGAEIQDCFERFELPSREMAGEIARMENHELRLRLPRVTARLIARLRRTGWRLGILTNGPRGIQTRKLRSLGLDDGFDAVVFAPEHGTGYGKPDVEPFAEIARLLDVAPARTVMVGDHEICDVQGAIGAGMHAVRCDVWTRASAETAAAAAIDRLDQVPAIAVSLVMEESSHEAA